MKMRKVIVTLEVETALSLRVLQRIETWDWVVYDERGKQHRPSVKQVNVVGKSDHEKHVALAKKVRASLT